jgi:hypothetical protein
MRPEPPATAPPTTVASVTTPPELADYAELCA